MTHEWSDEVKKEMWAQMFKTNKAQYNRCLEPTNRCEQKAIRAHSIQNSRILDNMVANNHVTAFARRIDKDNGPIIDYGSVGRNQATTFTGLCAEHDNEIFSAIDDEEIDLNKIEHLFLLAYRAVYRQYHAAVEAGAKIQSAYQKRIEMGLEPEDELSEIGKIATHKLLMAWMSYRYKVDYDLAYLNGSYDSIHHDSFSYDVYYPTIAACALFAVDNQVKDGEHLRVAINILPVTKKKTVVILSYREKDSSHARMALDRVINSEGHHQQYEISRLLLNNCENFVICPTYFDSWSDNKKSAIRDYYIKTIFKGDLNYESPDIFLF